MKQNNKGFTLIELLVVITIITILATISIPQFAKYRLRAYNVVALSDLRNLKTDLEAIYTDNLKYPTTLIDGKAAGEWLKPSDWNAEKAVGEFLPSNNVNVYYNTNTDSSVYVIMTNHEQGDRVFGTTSHSGKIYEWVDDAFISGTTGDLNTVKIPTVTSKTMADYDDRFFQSNPAQDGKKGWRIVGG